MDEMGVDFGGVQDFRINGGDEVLSIGYEEMVGSLIKSNQEMYVMIQDLQTRLGEFESKQPPKVPAV